MFDGQKLSLRAFRATRALEAATWFELSQRRSGDALLLPFCGPGTVRELREGLRARGLSFIDSQERVSEGSELLRRA
jgi:hypothetical protein